MHPGYTKETSCHKVEDRKIILLLLRFRVKFSSAKSGAGLMVRCHLVNT